MGSAEGLGVIHAVRPYKDLSKRVSCGPHAFLFSPSCALSMGTAGRSATGAGTEADKVATDHIASHRQQV